jgi:penicillin-binding protein 2
MDEQRKRLERTLKLFLVAIIFIFASLSIRLFFLQVIGAEEFQTKSEKNRIRLLEIEARRGDILDRNNQVLATSKPVFTISLSHLDDKEEQERSIVKLAEILQMPELTADVIRDKVKKHTRKFEPVEIVTIPWGKESVELISRIEENRPELPGVNILEQPMRYYPNGSLAGHLLGFIGRIDQQELEKYGRDTYGLNDKIGKTGLERVYELVFQGGKEIGLRGKKGAQQVEVNARGQVVGELPLNIQPVPGNSLQLTIDGKLQKVMEKSMDEVIAEVKKKFPKAGAGGAVVIDVKTGAILAIASKPDMNPNDFVDGSFAQKLSYYNDQKLLPVFNRAIQATYPPGSTFKMITGMAALASGNVKATDKVTCTGRYWKPPYIKCWDVHGVVDFYRAIAVSCNTFFQYAGEKAGIEWIDKVAKEFGLGEKTGISDLLGEAAGILPSPERKAELNESWVEEKHQEKVAEIEAKYRKLLEQADNERERKQLLREKEQALKIEESRYKIDYDFYVKWRPYETYNTSIGQGDNNYTILQLANYIATLANGGNRYQPYLVSKIISPDGKVLKEFRPKLKHRVSLDPQILAEARKGMLAVTQPGGTAYSLFKNFPAEIKVGAKTGTAQTGRAGDDKRKEFHGVFVAFAPYDNPQIAFAGLIEYGESGGASAGKVAKAVFEEYFGINPVNENIKDRTLESPLNEDLPAEIPMED